MKNIWRLPGLLLFALTLTACAAVMVEDDTGKAANTEAPWMQGLLEATDSLRPYNVYLLGEGHANSKTYIAELQLLKYFYQYHGVRAFMLEDGFCDAALLNDYFRTGNADILDVMMQNLRGSAAYNNEHRAFYENLRAFYETLPKDDTFTIYGIDVQHQHLTGIYYLRSLLKENAPEQISQAITRLITPDDDLRITRLTELRDLMEAEKALFAEYLAGKDAAFVAAITALEQGATYYSSGSNEFREACLTDNFFAIYTGADEKMATILGNWHTNLAGWPADWPFNNIAQNIADRIGLGEGGMASICCVYQNSFSYSGSGNNSLGSAAGKVLAARMDADMGFFILDAADANEAIRQLREECQYAIAIVDSPAAKVYR